MTYLTEHEERDADDRFDAHQDALAAEADERDRLGFAVGDLVTVGKGRIVWRVEDFFGGYSTNPGVPLVRLQRVDLASSNTSVEVTRLRAVR